MTQRCAARWLALLVLASLAGAARAEPVRMPFIMDRPFLESLLRERVFVGEGHRLRAGDDGTGCQILIDLRRKEVLDRIIWARKRDEAPGLRSDSDLIAVGAGIPFQGRHHQPPSHRLGSAVRFAG